MNFGPYAKAINGTLTAVLAALIVSLPDGMSLLDWLIVASTLVANGVAIYTARNTDRAPYAKAIANAIVTGIGVVSAALTQGDLVTVPLVLSAVVALLNALVVVPQTPNAQESDDLIVLDPQDTEHADLQDADAGEAENIIP